MPVLSRDIKEAIEAATEQARLLARALDDERKIELPRADIQPELESVARVLKELIEKLQERDRVVVPPENAGTTPLADLIGDLTDEVDRLGNVSANGKAKVDIGPFGLAIGAESQEAAPEAIGVEGEGLTGGDLNEVYQPDGAGSYNWQRLRLCDNTATDQSAIIFQVGSDHTVTYTSTGVFTWNAEDNTTDFQVKGGGGCLYYDATDMRVGINVTAASAMLHMDLSGSDDGVRIDDVQLGGYLLAEYDTGNAYYPFTIQDEGFFIWTDDTDTIQMYPDFTGDPTLFIDDGAGGPVTFYNFGDSHLDGDNYICANTTDTLSFFGAAGSTQSAAYTPSNVTPDRTFDASSTNLGELANVLGTLIADLQAYGLIG